jgi:hypothetical protein
MMVFFENEHCVKCSEVLGFFPDTLEMASEKQWTARSSAAKENSYRNCANKDQYQVCNWMISGADQNSFCLACRLNEVIPDLTINGNRERWYKLEMAKRRCLYTFLQLGLPIETPVDNSRAPLRFRFLGDDPNKPVLTGHENGIITINISEADEDERERRRLKLHEPYRTLVGHIRHESGHYYWDRLIANSPHLQKFHELFGDETVDYNEALEKYYKQGPAADWTERTVTAYASLHPWEDWAETWAHYLHMVDTLETAASFGIGLNKTGRENAAPQKVTGKISGNHRDFEKLIADWPPLICALNSVNRGMGLSDLYPFVIPEAAIEKLRFIHEVIETEANKPRSADSKIQPRSRLQTAD